MPDLLAASLIREIPDFPKPGIIFKDITPILQDPAAFEEAVNAISAKISEREADVLVGIESRGFILGAPAALKLKLPFVVTRKEGKLPYDRVAVSYDLEYGQSTIEMHRDSIKPGQRAYIIDDLLATGGTAAASMELVRKLGGVVSGFGCLIELSFLHGRDRLGDVPIDSLIVC